MNSGQEWPILGRWRITETDTWDRAYLDLVEPAFILLALGSDGEFRFGVVSCGLSCGYSPTMAHFDFHGSDEGDEVWGDGWAELQEDGTIEGEIAFKNGDECMFKARRWRSGDEA